MKYVRFPWDTLYTTRKIIHLNKINLSNYFKSGESFFSPLLLFDFNDEVESSKSTFRDDGLALDALLLLVSGNVQDDSLLFSS